MSPMTKGARLFSQQALIHPKDSSSTIHPVRECFQAPAECKAVFLELWDMRAEGHILGGEQRYRCPQEARKKNTTTVGES